jgi:hypothetical protein
MGQRSDRERAIVSMSMSAQIVRVWKGSGTAEGVDRYCREHFSEKVLPQLRSLSGFLDATALTRSVGTETDVVVATFWESIDSVKAFAGESYEKAVVEPIVHEFLERFDDQVAHFTVAVDG